MIKKIISAVSALSMLAAFAVAPVNAAEVVEWQDVEPIVTYQTPPVYGTGEATGNSTANLTDWGLTHPGMWTVIYTPTPPASDVAGDWTAFNNMGYDVSGIDKSLYAPALRFSIRNPVSGEQELANFNFATNTKHGLSEKTFDGAAYLVEMDFSAAIRRGSMRYDFIGDTGTFASMYVTYTSSGKAQISFGDSSKAIDITTGSSKTEIDYLKLYIDLENQTCSAWAATRGKDGNYQNPMTVSSSDLMVADQKFSVDNVTKFTDIKLVANNTSNDRMDISILKISDLTNNNIVYDAMNNISIPSTASDKLVIPATYLGANITWESLNTDIISNDGTVHSTAAEQQATIAVTFSRDDATATKNYTVTVPAVYVPVPVPEDGVWVDDNMDYASVDEIPAIANNAYGFEFEQDGGTVSTSDGTITLVRETNTGNLGMYKYLAPSTEQQHNDKQIVEYKITKIGRPVVYTAVQSYNDWKGIQTLQINEQQEFSPYTGSGWIDAPESMTVTMITDAALKTMDVYVNGKLQWNDIAYRSNWSNSAGFDYFGRIYMSVSNSSPVGSGIKVDYIRTFEDIDSYGTYCLEKAGAGVDIPSEIAAGVDEISLPTADNYNNTIAWSSDNAAISTDGTVTHGITDVAVQLTPTYTNNVTEASKEGAPITVTVKAKKKTTTVGDPLKAINPDITGGETQYAVGFMNTFTSQNTGYAPEFGFILSYQDKTDMTVMISDNVEASEVKAGVILTYDEEDGFVLDDLKVRPYITE